MGNKEKIKEKKFNFKIFLTNLKQNFSKGIWPYCPIILFLFGVGLLGYLTFDFVDLTLNIIDFNYISWGFLLGFILLFVFLYFLYLWDSKYKKIICGRWRINFWVLLSFFLICMGVFISGLFLVNGYPGPKEMKVNYPLDFWEDDDFSVSFQNKISKMYVSDSYSYKNRYFIEGSEARVQMTFYDSNYFYNITLDNQNETMEYKCHNLNPCVFDFEIIKTHLYHFVIYGYNSSHQKDSIAVINIRPNVLTKEESNEKERNTVIILGSIFSVIFFLTLGAVRNLKDLMNKHKLNSGDELAAEVKREK